jgi:hypothetical protein
MYTDDEQNYESAAIRDAGRAISFDQPDAYASAVCAFVAEADWACGRDLIAETGCEPREILRQLRLPRLWQGGNLPRDRVLHKRICAL